MATSLNPDVLRWAAKRSGLSLDQIKKPFPKFEQWLDGTWTPTIRQIRNFAKMTHVSVSELYGENLPDYALQIADFRTVNNKLASNPSPALFDTIEAMLNRQDWMRDFFVHQGYQILPFVGSYQGKPQDEATAFSLAAQLHDITKLGIDWAASCRTVDDALRTLKGAIEAIGISVVINGVVGDNTRRPLDVEEFRGFALSDAIAPIIFLNGRDAKSAQIFTLVHELCHIAYAETGVSNAPEDAPASLSVERFCNKVAAEFLLPAAQLKAIWATASGGPYKTLQAITRTFKVSFETAAFKVEDSQLITHESCMELVERYRAELPDRPKSSSGGNYYNTKQYRLGAVFSDAIITAVRSGYVSYRDAYDLAEMSAPSFKQYFEKVG